MQIIFFATPDFAVPSLQQLISHSEINLLAVVTQPDKPVGRKQKLTPPPIKVLASEHCIPIYQPEKLNKDEELIEKLKSLKADFIVTAAYGQILKQQILDIPKYGVINLHASLLPEYRGAAPINWMLINGEEDIGVSTMYSDVGVDTGPVIDRVNMISDPNETAEVLSKRMSLVGADLLIDTLINMKIKLIDLKGLPAVEFQAKTSTVQEAYENLDVSKQLAPFLSKELGKIDFRSEEIHYSSPNPRQEFFKYSRPNNAENIHNLCRGLSPWPGTFFMHEDTKVGIIGTEVAESADVEILNLSSYKPGQLIKINHKEGFIWVMTQSGVLQINYLKPAGKKEMKASDCLNGFRLNEGDIL